MPFPSIAGNMLTGAATNWLSNKLIGEPKVNYDHLKYGVQWRVEDAKRAGIHPIYALGANVSSPIVTQGSAGKDAYAAAAGAMNALMQKDQLAMNRESHKASMAESRARIRKMEREMDLAEK